MTNPTTEVLHLYADTVVSCTCIRCSFGGDEMRENGGMVMLRVVIII